MGTLLRIDSLDPMENAHHMFRSEMRTSDICSEWCIMEYGTNGLWKSIIMRRM